MTTKLVIFFQRLLINDELEARQGRKYVSFDSPFRPLAHWLFIGMLSRRSARIPCILEESYFFENDSCLKERRFGLLITVNLYV